MCLLVIKMKPWPTISSNRVFYKSLQPSLLQLQQSQFQFALALSTPKKYQPQIQIDRSHSQCLGHISSRQLLHRPRFSFNAGDIKSRRTLTSLNQLFCNSINHPQAQAQQIDLHTTAKQTFRITPYQSSKFKVLGIETSCDDTGVAVMDEEGNVLGEAINSQTSTHLKTGGIIPNVAKELHSANVESVVHAALENAKSKLQDMDAIAVTVKPGLVMSLRVGLRYAQSLAKIHGHRLIPIHHMEAHALTARMIEDIKFPFLVLLASGGHCLLAVARDLDDFLLLGTTLDDAPGEAFDKTARDLNLSSLPEFKHVLGGVAVEKMAKQGNPHAFPPVHVMASRADCNFSFTGLKIAARRQVGDERGRQGLSRKELLPNAADICAWFQTNVTHHLARRLQRAFIYTEMVGLLGENKTLVVSGGVACNMFIRQNLEHLCSLHNCRLVCPPPKLCTDNGIMIAWNAVEKLRAGRDCLRDPESLEVQARSAFGQDISRDVTNATIKLPKLRLVGT